MCQYWCANIVSVSYDRGRRVASFCENQLKIVMKNDRGFVDVILL